MAGCGGLPPGRLRAVGRAARMRHADPHTLVGAYVMDAVTDADRTRFDQHLVGCGTCQAEVRGLREATARLAAAAAIRPRDGLREQTMQAAGLVRQLPPLTGEGRAGRARAGRRGSAPRRAARPTLARVTGAGRPRAWLAVLVVAALVIVAVGFGVAMRGAEEQLNVAQGRTHVIAAVLAAPDATMLTGSIRRGGSATVVMSHRTRVLVFTAAGLPALPSSRSYEVWLMGPDGSRAVGMLPVPRHGMAGPMVVAELKPGDRVCLTIEPAGGSPRPTSSPILMLDLGT